MTLAKGAVCDCCVIVFLISKECCLQSLSHQGTTHLPSGRVLWSHSPEKVFAIISCALSLERTRNEACASAQHLVDTTACVGFICVLSLTRAQIVNTGLESASIDLAELNDHFLVGFIYPLASKGADKSFHNTWEKISRSSAFIRNESFGK